MNLIRGDNQRLEFLVCNSTQALLYDELGMADFVLNPNPSYENNTQSLL